MRIIVIAVLPAVLTLLLGACGPDRTEKSGDGGTTGPGGNLPPDLSREPDFELPAEASEMTVPQLKAKIAELEELRGAKVMWIINHYSSGDLDNEQVVKEGMRANAELKAIMAEKQAYQRLLDEKER